MQKYTKFDFDWSSAPNPTGEAYSTPPDCIKATEVKKGKRNRREGKRRRRRAVSYTHLTLPTILRV